MRLASIYIVEQTRPILKQVDQRLDNPCVSQITV